MGIIREDGDQDEGPGPQHETEENVEVEREVTPPVKDDVEVVEDERVAQPEEEDEPEEGEPHRRRETARERRDRARQAKERDKRELSFQKSELDRLSRRLDEVNRAQTANSITDLDNRISTASQEVEQMDRVKALAISKNQGADAVAADNLRNQAQWRLNDALARKDSILQDAARPKSEPLPYLDKAQAFMSDNPWYTHKGKDSDSTLVAEIDAGVAKEYVPTSDAYWRELQRRVKLNLPHRFKADNNEDDEVDDTPPPRLKGGPPQGGSSRSNSRPSGTQIRLSPARVQALKDANLWDDPKDRMRMAKKYAEYDVSQRG